MPQRAQIVQLFRSFRDARKHKLLKSRVDLQEVHEHTVPLESAQGQSLLQGCTLVNTDLLSRVQAQEHPAFCGVANCTLILQHFGRHVTQQGLFAPFTHSMPAVWFRHFGFGFCDYLPTFLKCRLNAHLRFDGLPMNAAVTLLSESYNLDVQRVDKDGISVEGLRADVLRALSVVGGGGVGETPRTVLLTNYDRAVMLQRGTGHFAAVAAYNAEEDMCLLLEVNSFRYPHVFVKTERLVDAIATISPGGTRRGYLNVREWGE